MSKRSNVFCVLSLICMFGVPVIVFLVTSKFANGDISASTFMAVSARFYLNIISYIAAWIIAIRTRKKYKDNFSKTLIIIYASLLGLAVIAVIVLFAVFLGRL